MRGEGPSRKEGGREGVWEGASTPSKAVLQPAAAVVNSSFQAVLTRADKLFARSAQILLFPTGTLDGMQADLALSRTQQERLEQDLVEICKTQDLVDGLAQGQSVKLPLSSKGFLLGQVVEPSTLQVKLGALDL